jgi:hypothetical protein
MGRRAGLQKVQGHGCLAAGITRRAKRRYTFSTAASVKAGQDRSGVGAEFRRVANLTPELSISL